VRLKCACLRVDAEIKKGQNFQDVNVRFFISLSGTFKGHMTSCRSWATLRTSTVIVSTV
jgi:hypothetical protein